VEYFIMRQDPKLMKVAQIKDWAHAMEDVNPMGQLRLAEHETRVMFMVDELYNEYPDFFERPIKLIGTKLKRIMSLYQPNIYFETVALVEPKNEKQHIYHWIDAPEIDCASELSKRHFGKLLEIVLDVKKVGNQRIFHITGDPRLIVRLDVAESILRRIPYGITFERIKLEE